jgi:hypothetical protein
MRSVISKTLFALVALSASAGSALADEPAPAAAAPAQTESLDSAAKDPNVSTIHGQLVPVGDKNQYTVDFKRWNVSTNPLGLVFGDYGLSISYGVSQNVALRADVNYYNSIGNGKDELHQEGYELGLGAPIYLRRTYQGFFVEPGVIVRKTTTTFEGEKADITELGPQVLLGWHWTWDSGFNVAFALGAGRNFSSDKDAEGNEHNEVFGNAYLRVGYAF